MYIYTHTHIYNTYINEARMRGWRCGMRVSIRPRRRPASTRTFVGFAHVNAHASTSEQMLTRAALAPTPPPPAAAPAPVGTIAHARCPAVVLLQYISYVHTRISI